MAEGRCGTCMFWQANDSDYHTSPKLAKGEGESWEEFNARDIALGVKFRQCMGVPFNPSERDGTDVQAVVAFTIDGSEYSANLFTTADFGCALYQATP